MQTYAIEHFKTICTHVDQTGVAEIKDMIIAFRTKNILQVRICESLIIIYRC